jgi:hypothetical protein
MAQGSTDFTAMVLDSLQALHQQVKETLQTSFADFPDHISTAH